MILKRNHYYLVAAVLVGLLGVFAMQRFVSMKTKVAAEPCSKVVVAQADIASGTALRPGLLRLATWPTRVCPPGVANSINQVNQRVVAIPVSKGEPIILKKLAPVGTAAGLGGLLKPNMRAFTVKVNDVSGVAGFIHPGDRVDVLVALRASGEQFSKIILQNIKVLTAGQVMDQSHASKPVLVNTVTLEVTPEQSEVLNLASTQGRIHLALRNRTNKQIERTQGVLTSYLLNGTKTVAKAETPPKVKLPASVRGRKVELIKGMELSSVTMM
jgi:pilus assembly protein CpaB